MCFRVILGCPGIRTCRHGEMADARDLKFAFWRFHLLKCDCIEPPRNPHEYRVPEGFDLFFRLESGASCERVKVEQK